MNIQQQDVSAKVNIKVQALMVAYDRLRAKNESLEERVQKLEETIKLKEELIRGMETNNSKVHLTQAFVATSTDAREAKERVRRIVREIDNCITLLNR